MPSYRVDAWQRYTDGMTFFDERQIRIAVATLMAQSKVGMVRISRGDPLGVLVTGDH